MHAYYILNIFRVIHHFPWRCEKNQVKKGASGSAVAALLFRLFFFAEKVLRTTARVSVYIHPTTGNSCRTDGRSYVAHFLATTDHLSISTH
jgi:hypothetical protein